MTGDKRRHTYLRKQRPTWQFYFVKKLDVLPTSEIVPCLTLVFVVVVPKKIPKIQFVVASYQVYFPI